VRVAAAAKRPECTQLLTAWWVLQVKDGEFARVKTWSVRTGRVKVASLKVDLHYWPTTELRRDAGSDTWQRSVVTAWPPVV
jgi:hypothetical protein